MKNLIVKIGPLLALLAVYALFAALCPPEFLGFYNFKTIITQTVIVGIAAMGMTMIIISGGIDLSVGSQIALGTVVAGLVLNSGGEAELQVSAGQAFLAAMAAITVCALCGIVIGVFSARLKIVPFIVTLGMMQIARGVAKWMANEQTVSTPQNGLQSLMMVDPEPSWLVFAPGVWIAALLVVITIIILKYTILGRYTFAIGSNEKTALLCGIPVVTYRIIIYTIGAAFAGVSSVMQYSNLTVGDPTAAAGMELDVIAAVVIGGGSLSGGEGSAVGSIVGALIMAVLRNGSNMLGLPNYVQEIIIGAIIVGAVALDRYRNAGK
jgi:ribose transport system permease protein